jgi:hypothetical protein
MIASNGGNKEAKSSQRGVQGEGRPRGKKRPIASRMEHALSIERESGGRFDRDTFGCNGDNLECEAWRKWMSELQLCRWTMHVCAPS